jgi:hypothetical protein
MEKLDIEEAAGIQGSFAAWEHKFQVAMSSHSASDIAAWVNALYLLKLFSDSKHFRDCKRHPDPEKLLLQEAEANNLSAVLRFFVHKHKIAVEINF